MVYLLKTKFCTLCGEEKLLSMFYNRSANKTHGKSSKCKSCQDMWVKENQDHRDAYLAGWRARNPTKGAEAQERFRSKNREGVRFIDRLQKKGLTVDQYWEIYDAQGGCCAWCGKHETEHKKDLCIDHEHETGQVRRLLCETCNWAEGHIKAARPDVWEYAERTAFFDWTTHRHVQEGGVFVRVPKSGEKIKQGEMNVCYNRNQVEPDKGD